MKRKFRGIAATAVALGFVAATAAISSGASEEAANARGGVPGIIKAAADTPNISKEERDAFKRGMKTGRIDPADNMQAHVRYKKCMKERGYNPKFRHSTKGFFVELPYTGVTDPAALDAAVADCAVGNTVVQAAFLLQETNPKRISDNRVVAVECLIEEGVVKRGYSADQFERDLDADQFPFDADAVGPNDCLYAAGYAYFTLAE